MIEYSYRDVPTIRRFALSNAFFRAIMGPFGSGKSSGAVAEFPRRGQAQKPGRDGIRRTRWAAVRNTYGQLRDTTIKTFFEWLPPAYFGRYYAQDHRYVIKRFPGCEIEILFRALDKPEDVRNLLSLDLTGGWINEVREIPWAVVDALQGRCGRYPSAADGGPTWFGMWADTNPPDTDSKFYDYFENKTWEPDFRELQKAHPMFRDMQPDDFAVLFKQPSGLSPAAENLKHLPAGYYQRLGVGKSQEWKKVYIKGDYGYVSDNKTVYDDYSDPTHLREFDPIPRRTIYRGWDFGLTPTCGFSQLMPSGHWGVFDEMISSSMGIDRFSDEVLNHCGRSFHGPTDFVDYGDPAGEQRAQTDERTCFDILQNKGIMISPGLQSTAIRMESMRYALRHPVMALEKYTPTLMLHPRCKVTRKGFMGGYHFRRISGTSERYTETPEKNHPYSDIMNSHEYVATILFGASLTDRESKDDYPRGSQQPSDVGRSDVTGY